MPAFKVIVMDFDGTLVDTMGGFADVAGDVLHRWFGTDPVLARRRYLETSGIPFRQQVEVLHSGDARNDAAAEEFESRKLAGFFAETFPRDAVAAVGALQARGFKVVVSSNNFQELVDEFCARHDGVSFDVVLGAREGFYKGRDHFRVVEERFAVTPGEMLFVGDSLKDGERALACGVAFVGKVGTFTRDEFEARFPGVRTIERLSDLVELLS